MSTLREYATVTAGTLRPGRVPELDGLRAFAILPVILHHCYPYSYHGLPGWVAFVGEAGWMGVDLFFVLSGYLITGILLDTVDQRHFYRNFIARRTIRIFPLYYVCLALFITVSWMTGGSLWVRMREWGFGWFVVYLGNIRQAWLGALPPIFLFAPLWSLQIEEQFYLIYPIVVSVLSRRNLRRFLLGCVVAAPLIRSFLLLFVPGSEMARYVLMPCRMDALALGGLVANLARSPSDLTPSRALLRCGAIAMCAAALGVYIFAWHTGHAQTAFHPLVSSLGYSISAAACASLLVVILLCPSPAFVALLRWRPLVYTGKIAYGLYLLHGPAGWMARKLMMLVFGVYVEGHSLISVPLTYIASFLVASASWRFFESPMLALKERFTSPIPAQV